MGKLAIASVRNKYQTDLGSRVAINPLQSLDEHWRHSHDFMKMECRTDCGLAKRPALKNWVFIGFL